MRSPRTGSPSSCRSAAPWATRQYRQPLAELTTTAIISRSAALRCSVGSWSWRKWANQALRRSGRNAYTRNTFGTNPSRSRAFANSPCRPDGSSASSGTGNHDPVPPAVSVWVSRSAIGELVNCRSGRHTAGVSPTTWSTSTTGSRSRPPGTPQPHRRAALAQIRSTAEQLQPGQELLATLLVGAHGGVDLGRRNRTAVGDLDVVAERAVGVGDQGQSLDDVLLALGACPGRGGLVRELRLQRVQIADLMAQCVYERLDPALWITVQPVPDG